MRTKTGRLRPLALTVVIALTAACSGAGASPGGGGRGTTANPTETLPPIATSGTPTAGTTPGGVAKPDPCKLLTTDELTAQVGVDIGAGALDPFTSATGLAGPNRAYCTWIPTNTQVFRSVTLVIDWVGAGTTADYESGRVATAKTETGIGDDAYLLLASSTGSNSTLAFRKAGLYGTLNAGGADWLPSESQMVALARLAASRM